MNFRDTARRMISEWKKNKKRAGSDLPKNDYKFTFHQSDESLVSEFAYTKRTYAENQFRVYWYSRVDDMKRIVEWWERNSPKNETQEKQLEADIYNHGLKGACELWYNTHPPKEQKLAAEKYDKRMEAVIESIATNPSMGDHFAYFNATPLCGSCNWEMQSESTEHDSTINFKQRFRCLNMACLHQGILYEVVPEKSAVIVMRRVDEKKTE